MAAVVSRRHADLNLTLATPFVFFGGWIVWALREIGPAGFGKELFAPKGESTAALKLLMVVVFFAAGCLEIISILFRPVSLSFRLYGNIFAGENMLKTTARLIPRSCWLLPIRFHFLELLAVGQGLMEVTGGLIALLTDMAAIPQGGGRGDSNPAGSNRLEHFRN